jgi:hypothetical protein
VTAQVPDRCSYDGHEWSVLAAPLRPWLRNHPDIEAAFRRGSVNSSNWTGYTADWVVRDGNLYLAGVWSNAISRSEALMGGLPLLAGWVTGELGLLIYGHEREHQEGATATVAGLRFEAGHLMGARVFPVVVEHSIGGPILKQAAPAITGIDGDDTFWGLQSDKPWFGGRGLQSQPALEQIADHRTLYRLLSAALIDVL